MRLSALNEFWIAGPLSATLLFASVAPHVAQAGDWDFRHRTAVGLTHVDRTGNGAQSGMVLQAIPQIYLSGSGGRVAANLNYSLTASAGTDDMDPRPLAHNGFGSVRVEAVEDFFWLGAQATARLSGGSRNSGPVDAINANTDGANQTFSFAIKPEFRHHLNRYAEIVSLNSFDYVNNDTDDATGSRDSRSALLNLSLRDGRYFSQFDWGLNATQRRTNYSSDDSTETRSLVDGTISRRLDAHWSVLGRVGYEDNDVRTTRSTTSGTIWDLGGTWNPSPRTTVNAEFGSRYFGPRYKVDLRHRSRRTLLTAGFSRDIDNRRTNVLLDSYFLLTDSNGNPVLDPNTGNPIYANTPDTRATDEDFVNTQFRAAVTVTGRRTNVTLTGTVSNRDYEVTPGQEDWFGGTLRITRQLGSNYRASLGGNVRSTRNENGGDIDSYDVNLLLSKNLSPITTVAVDFLYRDYDHSLPGLSYKENRVGIWYRTTFL